MEWYTPNGEFKFVLAREYNRLWNNQESQYICILDLYNNLNIKLFSIRMTEYDVIRVVEEIITFIDYNQSFAPHHKTYIHMNTNNTTLSNFTICLSIIQNIDDSSNAYQKSIFYNPVTDEYRDITFTFLEYNPIYEKLVPRINIIISISELFDFCFHLFFEFLIDIDIPMQFHDTIEYLAEIFMGEIS